MDNNNISHNYIGERVPPSIKLERKKIKSEKQKEQNDELYTKNELQSYAKKLFNN